MTGCVGIRPRFDHVPTGEAKVVFKDAEVTLLNLCQTNCLLRFLSITEISQAVRQRSNSAIHGLGDYKSVGIEPDLFEARNKIVS
jgi:hypothetical protein